MDGDIGILDVKFKAPWLKDDDYTFWNLLEHAIDIVYRVWRKEILKVEKLVKR